MSLAGIRYRMLAGGRCAMRARFEGNRMSVIWLLLLFVSALLTAALALAIYASAMIARPVSGRKQQVTILSGDEPSVAKPDPRPTRFLHRAIHRA
nr:hypothetical protein CIT39_04950 [Bradyrhizobium symbiodeficiens]